MFEPGVQVVYLAPRYSSAASDVDKRLQYIFTGLIAWFIISSGTFLILIAAPVENINRELDLDEKKHCKEITKKVLIGIIVYSVGCSLAGKYNIVSLVALTILVVLFSQYIGIVMYKFEKAKQNNIKN